MIFKRPLFIFLLCTFAHASFESNTHLQLTSRTLDEVDDFQGGFVKFDSKWSFNEKRDDFGLLIQPSDKIFINSRVEFNHKREHDEVLLIGQKNGFQKQLNAQSSLFLGENIVIWGRGDEINPTDVWNAEDLEYFFVREKSLRKIPRTMLVYEWLQENKKIQFILSPHEQRMQSQFAQSDSGWCNIACQATSKSLNRALYAELGFDTEFSKVKNFEGFDAGLRFSNSYKDIDFALSVYNGATRLPVFNRNTDGTNISFEPYTTVLNSYGADLSYTAFGYTFIFESQYTTSSPFYIDSDADKFLTDNDGLILKDELESLIGISRMFTYDIYLNMQYMKAYVLGEDSDIFYFGARELASLQLSKVFYDDFKFEVTYLADKSIKNFSENYELSYKYNDNYDFALGGYLITSHDDQSLFTGLENTESYYINLNGRF